MGQWCTGGEETEAIVQTSRRPSIQSLIYKNNYIDLEKRLDAIPQEKIEYEVEKGIPRWFCEMDEASRKEIQFRLDKTDLCEGSGERLDLEMSLRAKYELTDEEVKDLIDYNFNLSVNPDPPLSMEEKEIVNFDINKKATLDKTYLGIACEKDFIECVKILVKFGADVNAGSPNGFSLACGVGSIDIASYLLEQGADSDGGVTAACQVGNIEMINFLIENGIALEPEGLEVAAANGHVETVELLLSKNVVPTEAAFQSACENDYLEIVKLLVENGSENITSGWFPAIRKNNFKIIKYLLNDEKMKKNIDMVEDESAKDGIKNAFIIACETGNLKLVKLLMENGCNVDFLAKSVKDGLPEVTDYAPADGIYTNYDGLIFACRNYHYEVFQYLMEHTDHTTRIKVENQSIPKILSWMCEYSNKEAPKLLQILIDHGLDVTDGCLDDGFVIACETNHVTLVTFLIEHGININHQHSEKFRVIKFNCRYADKQRDERSNRTGFFMACEKRSYEVMKLLIDNKADLNIGFEQGKGGMSMMQQERLLYDMEQYMKQYS